MAPRVIQRRRVGACGALRGRVIGCLLAWSLVIPPALFKTAAAQTDTETGDDITRRLARICGRCHGVPAASSAPRHRWEFMLREMRQHAEEMAEPIDAATLEELVHHYEQSAPESLPKLPQISQPSGLRFRWQYIRQGPQDIADVHAADLDGTGKAQVLISSASLGTVGVLRPSGAGWEESPLADGLSAPSRTDVADIDGDGDMDVVVAGLGRLLPTDDAVGSVSLLVNNGSEGFTARTLLEGVPRVSDVSAADFDDDGDIDIAVGMFGYIRSGAVGWLEQTAAGEFRLHPLFSFPGTVNVEACDLNGDGLRDFVALVSQAQEQVVAFINAGEGRFEPSILFDAGNPLFGSSSMRVVDLDSDGDEDILFTNGDVFDARPELRPENGVQWLENSGGLRFSYHDLGRLYGAFGCAPGDLDGDGDTDVVAVSFFNDWQDRRRQSVVWFENDGRRGFSIRGLANTPTDLAVVDVGDLDGDGRPDIVAGSLKAGRAEYLYGPPERRARLAVWTNLGSVKGERGQVRNEE